MRVGIVGAGIAGLSVARTLVAGGVRVQVFDKGRASGGRIATRRTPTAQFDHGAQYFTVRARLFQDFVEECVRDGIVAEWEGRFGLSDGRRTMPARPSGIRYVGTPKMSTLSRTLSEGIVCKYGLTAQYVERYRKRWRIVFEDGSKSGLFDVIITTCPPKQSVDLVRDSEELVRQCDAIQMQPCWALMVELKNPAPYQYDGVRVTSGPFNWVARNSSKPGRPEQDCWVAHTSPKWSAINLEESADDVAEQLLEPLLNLIGVQEAPAFYAAHRWRYARIPSGLDSPGRFLWDGRLKLGAVGDWCTSSRVEDAFMNGVRIAEMLLDQES